MLDRGINVSKDDDRCGLSIVLMLDRVRQVIGSDNWDR